MEVEREQQINEIQFPVNFIEQLVEGNKKERKPLTSFRFPFIVYKTATKTNEGKLQKGDQIVAINGQQAEYLDEIKPFLEQSKGEKIEVTIDRDGEKKNITLQVDDKGMLGVELNNDLKELEKRGYLKVETKKYTFWEAIPVGLKKTKNLSSYIDNQNDF